MPIRKKSGNLFNDPCKQKNYVFKYIVLFIKYQNSPSTLDYDKVWEKCQVVNILL